jgi:hypothetical protein
VTRFLPDNKYLNVLLVAAVVAVILIDFVFADVPELFSGGARIGLLIHATSLAYIASYIFYLVVVHLKQLDDKRNIQPFIASKTKQVVVAIRSIILAIILHTANDPKEKYPSKTKLEDMCKQIDPNGLGPDAYRNPITGVNTWMDYFRYWKKNAQDALGQLFLVRPYLESAHVRILLRIHQSGFFSFLDMFPQTANKDLTFLADSLYDLSELARTLESYCDEQFKNVEPFK